ncbi:hypothetical protein [Sphingomonas sp.]|uniref:DUF3617 domain-containing protein n=1 Tax=Sphingomonas sp. TaxID=28214 RepID=UPI002BB7DD1C|nr:hypothetical protein [Sphingomonas sp.]HWK36715.1 hypothetical protein [Sphingomonas sp.]
MKLRGLARVMAAAGLTGWAVAALASPAQAPGFAALKSLEKGRWQLREAGADGRSVCLGDPATLFQQRHRGVQCSRLTLENTPTTATVSYSCPGTGHGRTMITVETPRLIRIESQGMEGGAPFSLELEGRHVGACVAGK